MSGLPKPLLPCCHLCPAAAFPAASFLAAAALRKPVMFYCRILFLVPQPVWWMVDEGREQCPAPACMSFLVPRLWVPRVAPLLTAVL